MCTHTRASSFPLNEGEVRRHVRRSHDTLGGIAPENTPQIVLLTFDDAINDLNRQLYVDLFENGRKNPNGCPISASFYVSHEWTDYSQVQNMYADGHELASHTIS